MQISEEAYSCAGGSSRARHFRGLTTHSEFCLRVAGCFHASKLAGALLTDIVKATRNHDPSFAGQYGITCDFKGLQGCCAGGETN
jgi:hypothetical protein